ncbi:NMT1-like family protein [Chitinophaga sp. CF118]|nr:NMT1-like family protein [Chitinophaga sp. CF118]
MLKHGIVDLGFVVVGMSNRVINKMLIDSTLHLIPFENRDAYLLRKPKLNLYTVPRGIYGINCPDNDYETFATKAMLIVRNGMSENDIYKVTEALFKKESEISNNYPFFHLEKIEDDISNYIPVNSGALRYYNKDKPSFLDRNINLIATLLSIAGIALSVIPLVKEMAKRRSKANNVQRRSVDTR